MTTALTTAAVRALDVTKRYGQGPQAVTALDQVSVSFTRGRFAAVVGASGSGKSTLLHCLAGLDTVDSGTVVLDDVELGKLGDRRLTRLRRDRAGFIFQSYNLIPTMTAEENILLPLRLARRDPDPAWLDRVLDATGIRDRLRHKPTEMSGGQQQRVAAARALAGRPAIVFADEPTGNLDSRSGAELLGLLRRCVDELGQTIVMVTHDPAAVKHADTIVHLADGRVTDEVTA